MNADDPRFVEVFTIHLATDGERVQRAIRDMTGHERPRRWCGPTRFAIG
jgi:hypothetical protein